MTLDTIKEKARKLLENNLVKGKDFFYTCPSVGTYQHQWFWDSCFHAIVWSYFNPEYAKKELLNLLKKQYDNGMFPHMYYWKKTSGIYPRLADWVFKRIWPEKDRTHITQPPLIAQAVLKVFETTNDIIFLEKMIAPLKNYYNWLDTERNLDQDGLLSVIHPWASGMDLLPIWDHVLKIKHFFAIRMANKLNKIIKEYNKVNWDRDAIRKLDLFLVKDVAFNVIYILNLIAMTKLCNSLGQYKDAKIFSARAELARDSLLRKCWDDNDHFYYSIHAIDDKILPEKTVCGLFPLCLDIEKKNADYLVNEYLLNKEEFGLPYPIPCVSKSSPHFNPKGSALILWRGPTWFSTNWYVVKGLQKNAFQDIANNIIDKMVEMVNKSGFREQYNPFTAKGYGAKNFGWSTLLIDLISQ
ncbi:MAG: MGH1-like glycoside hydrolase domain-containing protein [Candidatus Helarchaeota archaeon]